MIIGIDESGRGPFCGPLIIGICIVRKEYIFSKKIVDSKKLNISEIRKIVENETKGMKLEKIIVSPKEIDNENLNDLITRKISEYLQLHENVEAYIDSLGNSNKYEEYIEKNNRSIIVNVGTKFDEKYPVVSMAAIYAKYHREEFMTEINLKYSLNSGYPSDEVAIKSLKNKIKEIPENILRESWKTIKNIRKNYVG